jgi:uncharacterized repeat protein (TIGR03803 family)
MEGNVMFSRDFLHFKTQNKFYPSAARRGCARLSWRSLLDVTYRIPDMLGRCVFACGIALALLVPIGGVHAKGIKLFYSFRGSHKDGSDPYGGLILDSIGNLYGTTAYGGKEACAPFGCGVVFKLAPDGKESILHLFAGGKDGEVPMGVLVGDNGGNLYGTTENGGGKNNAGTVFEIAADGAETVLYAFTGKSDGAYPFAGLIEDSSGNLYGTTQGGGLQDCDGAYCGTVFKVAPDGTETVLYAFSGPPNDGDHPYGNLIEDSAGNFYGTTAYGGSADAGTVFKLAPDGTETVLYSFSGSDGSTPASGLIEDANGNLYGTTYQGGASGDGVVFELAPDGTETVMHAFAGGTDGADPYGGLIADKAGNLYGTTVRGGGSRNVGTVSV